MIPRRQLFGVVAVVVLVGAAMTAAATTASGMSAATTTYTDPAGDAQGGPDVTTVAISGDAATGTIQVAVTATGYLPASPDGLERNVLVWLDTDRNRATGDPEDGTEYMLEAFNDSSGRWWDMERWTGSDWDSIPESLTMSFSRSGDVLTWTLNTRDLGGATSFRFYVHACIWDTAAAKHIAVDEAPDSSGDWWEFDLSATTPAPPATPAPASTVTLKINAPKTTPRLAVAGKRFSVSFPVQFEKQKTVTTIDLATGETSTGTMVMWQPVSGGKMVCDPSVAGKVIAHAESFKNGLARLAFVIPKTAKGKLLKVSVKITATDAESGKTMTATKIATFRVR